MNLFKVAAQEVLPISDAYCGISQPRRNRVAKQVRFDLAQVLHGNGRHIER